MWWQVLVKYLLPDEEKRDPKFREELDRLAVIGLRVIAGVSIGGPLIGITSWLTVVPEIEEFVAVGPALLVLSLGLFSLALSFWTRARRGARWLGISVGYLVSTVQMDALMTARPDDFGLLLPGNVTMIMLVGIAALPLKPVHVLALGFPIAATYLGFAQGAATSLRPEESSMLMSMLVQVILICSGLTAIVYHQRVSAYRARREAEQSFEELRQAQSRLLVTENAASQGRFAAALSHELNSPIGALSSSLETLLLAFKKMQDHLERKGKLREVIVGATESAQKSGKRLKEIIERMKHLTNLDRADSQVVDLNELWTSTVALLRGELENKAEIELDLKPLPLLKCRPQHMSAVFSNLLRNSAASMDDKGTIQVTSDKRGDEVFLEVRDDGKGIPEERLPHLFDPSFRMEGSRVSTSWGLFVSRSIIAEHGGRIEIASTEGRGTTASIMLPVGVGGP